LISGFEDFCPAVRELVGRAGDDLKVWQLYDMEALPRYVVERAALIGDAAHPFQPCVYRLTANAAAYRADYIL
jgi:salicylate hydroxylase